MPVDKHEIFMRKALGLAEKGRGTVNPNPMVGALVVKNGRIISSAYHSRVGALHAEALALAKAGRKAEGATLYVTLEPCAHIGRTPPCTEAIIKSRIRKVFCAMRDPNPLNNGRGIKILKNYNIEVSLGLLKNEAEALNRVFIKYITKGIPFVSLKAAESLDGKIATRTGDSKWITSGFSRGYAHKLRSEVDAILVGVNTIIQDDPLLTSRRMRSPIKVIMDPSLRIPERAVIFSKKSPALNIIAILKRTLRKKSNIEKISHLNKRGILVISCQEKKGRIDLRYLLKELAELEIAHLLVEGGGDTAAGFLEEKGLVDKVLFFIAPTIIGGRDAVTSVEGYGAGTVKKSIRVKNVKIKTFGEDILIEGDI